jgi:hypothetical protein
VIITSTARTYPELHGCARGTGRRRAEGRLRELAAFLVGATRRNRRFDIYGPHVRKIDEDERIGDGEAIVDVVGAVEALVRAQTRLKDRWKDEMIEFRPIQPYGRLCGVQRRLSRGPVFLGRTPGSQVYDSLARDGICTARM